MKKTKNEVRVLPQQLTIDELVVELNHSAKGEDFEHLTANIPQNTGSTVKAELDLRIEELNKELRTKQYRELGDSKEPMIELFRRYSYSVASLKTLVNQKTKQVTYQYIPDNDPDAKQVAFNIPDFIQWADDNLSLKVDRTPAHKSYLALACKQITHHIAEEVGAEKPEVKLSSNAEKLEKENPDMTVDRLLSWAVTSLVPTDKNGEHHSFEFDKNDVNFVKVGASKHAPKSANKVQIVKPIRLYNAILRVAHCKVCGLKYEVE